MTTKPFDSSLKELVEVDQPGWGRLLGAGSSPIALVDADVSTVSGAADKVLRVEGPAGPYLIDLEPESGHAAAAPDKLLFNSAVLTRRHALPVRSVLLLLRRAAAATTLTGRLLRHLPATPPDPEPDPDTAHDPAAAPPPPPTPPTPPPTPYLVFDYDVVRVWDLSLDDLLAGGLGTLPLAPLTDAARDHLPDVLQRLTRRVRAEAPPATAPIILTATFLLLGLRYDEAEVESLLQGVTAMEESSTYQLILKRGQAQGLALGEAQGRTAQARAMLLRLGRLKFGAADDATAGALEAITSLETLEDLSGRILTARSWAELLAVPAEPPQADPT